VKGRIRNKRAQASQLKKSALRAHSRNSAIVRVPRSRADCCGTREWNGAVRRDPETPVHLGKDRIEIDGQPVARSSKIYLALNKPRGVVTTAADEKGREQSIPSAGEFTVARPGGASRQASEGLLLLTNDSEWAARITAPERISTKRITYKSIPSPMKHCWKHCEMESAQAMVNSCAQKTCVFFAKVSIIRGSNHFR